MPLEIRLLCIMQTRYIEKYEKENAREFLILLLWVVSIVFKIRSLGTSQV